MLTQTVKYNLADLLLASGEAERHIELLRIILCELKDFEPYAAFTRIDENRKGKIDEVDLIYFLESNGIHAQQSDISAIFHKYDTDCDRQLTYKEFLEIVLPGGDSDLRTIVCQRPTYDIRRHETLSYQVEYALSRLIQSEIRVAKKIEVLKLALIDNEFFSPKDSFHEVDVYFSGFIDFNNLISFFRKLDIGISEDECICILRRIDRNDDGRVDYHEFLHFCVERIVGLVLDKSIIDSPKRLLQRQSTNSSLKNGTRNSSSHKLYQSRSLYSPSKTNQSLMNSSLHKFDSVRKPESPKKSPISTSKSRKSSKSARKRSILKKSPSQGKLTSSNVKREYVNKITPQTKAIVINLDEEEEIARTLLKIIELDEEAEKIKQELALRIDFNLYDVFKCFDTKVKGFICARELKDGLESLDLYAEHKDLYRLAKEMDRDDDGRIRFSDFVSTMAPVNSDYGKLLEERQSIELQKLSSLSAGTKKLLRELFITHLENEGAIEGLRNRLKTRLHIDVIEIFKMIDMDADGLITRYDIKEYFERRAGATLSREEINFFIHRFDRDNDGRINFSEFSSEIDPKEQYALILFFIF